MNSIEQSLQTTRKILENLPSSWINLTTHRLDIYDETQAKSQFLAQLIALQDSGKLSAQALENLPTAYDYIRLGHQLSCVLEWLLAQINTLDAEQVISFASNTMPVLAVLRKNCLLDRKTYVYYDTQTSPLIDLPRLESIYGYKAQLHKVNSALEVPLHSDGTVIFVTQSSYKTSLSTSAHIDATVNIHPHYGSTMFVHNTDIEALISDVQHVRRRESIAITPVNALQLLREIVGEEVAAVTSCSQPQIHNIYDSIKANTGSSTTPLIATSGLSVQYAILMGLVEDALVEHAGKAINIILPPNCYGGTNDQARRVAALIPAATIVDLLVDGGQDLVASLDTALAAVAKCDGVPIVLAEIPTNPRVEVPNLDDLGAVLSAKRMTPQGSLAIEPTFMVDQTFCPNVRLLDQMSELAGVKTVSFSSGSKFPSGGLCIAGYCATNDKASALLTIIAKHLALSDNSALEHQLITLAEAMPSMPERIHAAYLKTRQFVEYIQQVLPAAKINFVSDDLAELGFTPSVFSLDLPTIGDTSEERQAFSKMLNSQLIEHMIALHPTECKHCVSYGQLKGSYWTIPATSTQGTTKEHDKDYIVRVALSPESNVEQLSAAFSQFCGDKKLI